MNKGDCMTSRIEFSFSSSRGSLPHEAESKISQKLQKLENDWSLGVDVSYLAAQGSDLLQQVDRLPSGSAGPSPEVVALKKHVEAFIAVCNKQIVQQHGPQVSKTPRMFASCPPTLERLPDELLEKIFQFVPLKDLGALQGTSGRCKDLVNGMLSKHLISAQQVLALSKENLETITSLHLEKDPYASIRLEDRDILFQEFMEKMNQEYRRVFPRKNPSLRVIATKLERELHKAIQEDIAIPISTRGCYVGEETDIPPFYTRESLIDLLQRIDFRKRLSDVVSDDTTADLVAVTGGVKFFSLLLKSITTADPLFLQIFFDKLQKAYLGPNGILSKKISEQKEEAVFEEMEKVNFPNQDLVFKKIHDGLCLLCQHPQMESFLQELGDLLIHPDSPTFLEDLQPFFIKHMGLGFSIAHSLTQGLKEYVRSNPTLSQIPTLNEALEDLSVSIQKFLIPKAFHLDMQMGLARIFNAIGKILSKDFIKDAVALLKTEVDMRPLCSKPNAETFEAFSKKMEESEWMDLFFKKYSKLNKILDMSNPTKFDSFLNVFLNCVWQHQHAKSTNISGNSGSLAFLATHPEMRSAVLRPLTYKSPVVIVADAMRVEHRKAVIVTREDISPLQSSFDSLAHLPFLLPQLASLQMAELAPPSIFRYFGESLISFNCNRASDLPSSFAVSKSPAILRRLQQEAKVRAHKKMREKISRIAHRAVKEMGTLALFAAMVFLGQSFLKK